MTFLILRRDEKQTCLVPASGVHAELLAELETTASRLLKLIELERSGVYDGFGQNFWTGSDSVLDATRKLVDLAERRAGELRDAGVEKILGSSWKPAGAIRFTLPSRS